MKILICTDKIAGSGEDAIPYMTWRPHSETGVIGVFDGLGGSGSMKYRDNHTIRTGAYLGSRVCRSAFKEFYLAQVSHTPRFILTKAHVTNLQHTLVAALQDKLQSIHRIESSIQSSMRRVLPSTMASVFYTVESTQCIVDVVWAGDSRIYCLTSQGLQQLTRDDVAPTNQLSFHDVMQDAPLTNCIRADAPFMLHHRQYTLPIPCIILAVSDGCYGYTSSPMHFEFLLLHTLIQSNSIDAWNDQLAHKLKTISQDDYSMGLVCLGWTTFSAMVQSMQSRFRLLHEQIKLIIQLDDIITTTSKTNQQYRSLVHQRTQLLEHTWNTYRIHYLSCLTENTHV